MRIWDRGTYETEKWEDGKLVVDFAGERVRGRYALFRTGAEPDWMIHRMDPPERGARPLPRGDRADARQASPRCPPTTPAGRRRSSGTACGRSPTAAPAACGCRPATSTRSPAQYPEVRRLSRQLGARDAVLDGELVAFDEDGRPSFERLQQRIHQTSEAVVRRRMKSHPVTYVIFDLLHLDGRDLMAEPYEERRELLAASS